MIYIDSTLHNEWNVAFNPKLCNALERAGVVCYLPQRDTDQRSDRETIFAQNRKAMDDASAILAIAQNESPNWGVEVGYAKSAGKKVVILSQNGHAIPLMAELLVDTIHLVDDIEDIDSYIEELAGLLK